MHTPTRLALPRCSAYLLRIDYEGALYYHVGMAGDPYYPSAHSAVHRLSGHNENEMYNALGACYLITACILEL
ncbi:MAG: hypothetical protein LW884_07860 [Bacteroidetes bacterium]|jgi:hypothetical protein|nr:hypothetical protein [Bacteroidota bacterium]